MRRIYLFIFLLLIKSSGAYSSSEGALFVKLPISAQSSAMAHSTTAYINTHPYINPAILGITSTQTSVFFSYLPLFPDMNFHFLSFSVVPQKIKLLGINKMKFLEKFKQSMFNVGVGYLNTKNIKEYNSKDVYIKDLSTNEFYLSVGYGMLIKPNMAVGLNLKYINQNFKQKIKEGVCVDVGNLLMVRMRDKILTFSGVVSNLGISKLDGEVFPLSINIASSLNIDNKLITLLNFKFIKNFEIATLSLGTEYIVSEDLLLGGGFNLALRVGGEFILPKKYKDKYKTLYLKKLSYGISLFTEKFDVGYAFIPRDYFRPLHHLSIQYKF